MLGLAVPAWADAPSFAFTRTSTNDVPGGATVTLSISVDANTACQAIEERLPGPLATNGTISGDGVYLPDRNAIRWGPFLGLSSTSFQYCVSGPEGNYTPEGSVSVDGEWTFDMAATGHSIADQCPKGHGRIIRVVTTSACRPSIESTR